jgi:hypothetical protein
MNNEYPLYPTLTEEGAKEAQMILDAFKERMAKVAKEALNDMYTDVIGYIESDSWTNFRNQMMEGFKDYNNRKIQDLYAFKEIRAQIFKDFREEIMKEMPDELVKENESLKAEMKWMRERRY